MIIQYQVLTRFNSYSQDRQRIERALPLAEKQFFGPGQWGVGESIRYMPAKIVEQKDEYDWWHQYIILTCDTNRRSSSRYTCVNWSWLSYYSNFGAINWNIIDETRTEME